jgi:hypothetical protein
VRYEVLIAGNKIKIFWNVTQCFMYVGTNVLAVPAALSTMQMEGNIPPKRWYVSTKLHASSQKTRDLQDAFCWVELHCVLGHLELEWTTFINILFDAGKLKGPIHDQSCCAKLFCATQVCPFTIKSISTIHGQPVAPHVMLRNMIDRLWAPLVNRSAEVKVTHILDTVHCLILITETRFGNCFCFHHQVVEIY